MLYGRSNLEWRFGRGDQPDQGYSNQELTGSYIHLKNTIPSRFWGSRRSSDLPSITYRSV